MFFCSPSKHLTILKYFIITEITSILEQKVQVKVFNFSSIIILQPYCICNSSTKLLQGFQGKEEQIKKAKNKGSKGPHIEDEVAQSVE